MAFGSGFRNNDPGQETRESLPWIQQLLIAAAVCATVITAGTLVVNQESEEIELRRRIDLVNQGSSMRAHLNSELNRVLYLTSGLSSYLTVRRNNLQKNEVEAILETLYLDSQHVRVLAIAVGYRITYVHPVKSNEKVIGLSYTDLPEQWPDVKRIIDGERPVLLGPINLVQGGSGLIYRVPIFVRGRYWGLLSVVIDSESMLRSALEYKGQSEYSVALRGKNSAGMQGAVFWGNADLFSQNDSHLVDIEVPGGKWVMALRAVPSPQKHYILWMLYSLVWLLGLTLGWITWTTLANRTKLAHLALFDPLTELPNRLLIGDRLDRALTKLRRHPEKPWLLMFSDLEHFKEINDRLGHRAGDVVLQFVGQRILEAVRETDTVGRWGGDEFVIIMENIERSGIPALSEKIRRAVEQPIPYSGEELMVSISIGYAVAPDDSTNIDELLRIADQRMYADKIARNAAR